MFKTFILPRMSHFNVLCNPSPKSVIYNLWQYLWYFKRSWLFSSNKKLYSCLLKVLEVAIFFTIELKATTVPFRQPSKIDLDFCVKFWFHQSPRKINLFRKNNKYHFESIIQEKILFNKNKFSLELLIQNNSEGNHKFLSLTAIINCSWESL